nr:ribosome biogenesis protein NOP53-like [Tanacetum cinerariifolium]
MPGVGSRLEMLKELAQREKQAEIFPEAEVEFFIKATAVEGDASSLITYYTLKVHAIERTSSMSELNDNDDVVNRISKTMGKSKSSRKGKKAWRKNISTQDIEDFHEKANKDALSGGSLTGAPNDSLFFVDKSRDLSVKRKIDKKREKVLRVDSILQKNRFVQAVPSSNCKKSQVRPKEVKMVERDNEKANTGMVDIWGEQGDHVVKKRKMLDCMSNQAALLPRQEWK